MSGVLQTLNGLIQSNTSFSNALASEEEINLDLNLEIELLILYLKINSSNTRFLSLEDHQVIEDIFSGRFVIDRNKLITKTRTITIKDLRSMMLKMEHERYVSSKNIIHLQPKPDNNPPKIIPVKSRGIIQFPYQQLDIKKLIIDAKKEFQTTMELNEDTSEYIKTVEAKYNERMTRALLNALTGRFNKLEPLDKKLLQGHLNIYPILYSIQNKLSFVDGLEFQQSNIGISRMEYSDEEVKAKEQRIKELNWREERLKEQLKSKAPRISDFRINELEHLIGMVQEEIVNERFNYYLITQASKVYNHNLVENIDRAIYENHIDLNLKYEDPIITFFAINYQLGKASFHCSTHVSTFQNLIVSGSLKASNELKKEV